MGADESRLIGSGATCPSISGESIQFPNQCRKSSQVMAWTLLHRCTLEKWKDGHAEGCGFQDLALSCDGVIHKDCSPSFCINRQGIIDINKNSSLFSFRKRTRFDKMAEHFEYNHIPAQMSSINHFRVKSVLCYRDTLIILHLSRNSTSQFGLLDLRNNKFMGIFGKQRMEFSNESLSGQLSPDKTKCLIRMPTVPAQGRANQVHAIGDEFHLFESCSGTLIARVPLAYNSCHFVFDPRFNWQRIAVTNFEHNQNNSLSLVNIDRWDVLKTNQRVTDTRNALYPFMKDLCYTKDGSLLIATILDTTCHCHQKRTRLYRPIHCSIYVFNSETTDTLYCLQYQRFTCTQHQCPINYTPVFSLCGNRMAVVMDQADNQSQHFVHVYKLPNALNLQSICRAVIRQNFTMETLMNIPLPPKIISYLWFKPEFN